MLVHHFQMHQAALKKQELENKLKHELTTEDDYTSNFFLTETKAGVYTASIYVLLSNCDACHVFILMKKLCSSLRQQWTRG